mmetsp:Transcript_11692/g.34802  ORF Transcript_11692/g.34802 Transcript_11692/m.34802 type:complete len:218 (-) Transcript_11692:924-1577(-)
MTTGGFILAFAALAWRTAALTAPILQRRAAQRCANTRAPLQSLRRAPLRALPRKTLRRAPRTAPTASLAGVTHRLSLDFGRETGTWMPPRWAQYGRTEFGLDLRYEDDGSATVVDGPRPLRGLALATGASFPVERAAWKVDTDRGGSTLRVVLAHGGLSVDDCVLEPGELYLSIPVFPGGTVSRKEGLMSIIAYRLVVRKERRLVGVWFATPVEESE